jgi:hypothetical protein
MGDCYEKYFAHCRHVFDAGFTPASAGMMACNVCKACWHYFKAQKMTMM